MLPIYSETASHRKSVVNTDYQTKVVADGKTSVWQHPHKVAITESVLLTGHPNHETFNKTPTKRWWRWHTISSMGFYRNKAGTIVIYNCARQSDGRRTHFIHNNMNKPMEMLQDATGPVADAFRQAMWETFKITSQEHFYPMMEKYDLHTHTLIPTNIRSAFKLDDWEVYTSYIFGKTRTPRLKAAVANTEPYVVALAHQARGLISDDVLVKFVENTHFDDDLDDQFKPHAPLIRNVIKDIPYSSREAIFSRGIDFLDTQRIKLLAKHSASNFYSANTTKSPRGSDSWSGVVRSLWGSRFDDPNYLSSL